MKFLKDKSLLTKKELNITLLMTLKLFMISMCNKNRGGSMKVDEKKAFLTVKLRNLKRKYARVKEHADQVEDAIELKCEIDSIERELNN
jgi:hypothetical protein